LAVLGEELGQSSPTTLVRFQALRGLTITDELFEKVAIK
jgi:hypothetical protein